MPDRSDRHGDCRDHGINLSVLGSVSTREHNPRQQDPALMKKPPGWSGRLFDFGRRGLFAAAEAS